MRSVVAAASTSIGDSVYIVCTRTLRMLYKRPTQREVASTCAHLHASSLKLYKYIALLSVRLPHGSGWMIGTQPLSR